ncbi:bifunctional phosphopantothenoylcysteine decarboxylase/phosphopantothenate--cysteine ligase CoaBC [Nakamurella aerolata]|uniref:Coenzyme A biosynthesis bifunctional protein CoaBC n=1 Tax=Nakamurella aerolata TaxID=1656892 RepID=A0A849ACN5_9ACTN|nr:bifunctional phosphopantothenoylcysteine decarboxylase/phosphopantothenate--cysteine ligase CoaBC [Nakamurella aerolata]NNG36250.1 bifunctional phosphopantothenoylcysteine decarboxylase/phosphopantothenate--cysteine ligase CoaBC [Nakamurella aerolata]
MPIPAESGAEIVVGVGGGIAAYKAGELIRRLRALPGAADPSSPADADAPAPAVTVVPTEAALQFVGAATFEALSGRPVSTSVFTGVDEVRHVRIGQHADLIVLAPATADLLARAAAGMADDLLTSTLLASKAPVLAAPAMHTEMWLHPATQANVATLRSRGVVVVPPAVGRLTGPDSGPGRLPEPEQLAQLAQLLLHRPDALPYDLAGRRIVVTAGGTREPLDPVRFLGNRSSGRQGYALALVAAARGADVTLIAANTDLLDPPGVTVRRVGSALELQHALLGELAGAGGSGVDAVVMNAAVADFRPSIVADHKIKKVSGAGTEPAAAGTAPAEPAETGPGRTEPAEAGRSIALTENPDILRGLVRARAAGELTIGVIVGFAAETGDQQTSALDFGRAKLARKGSDVLVVNEVSGGQGFEVADNAAVVLQNPDTTAPGEPLQRQLARGPKALIGAAVCDLIAQRLRPDAGSTAHSD